MLPYTRDYVKSSSLSATALTRFSCCQRKGQERAFLLPLSASVPPTSIHPQVELGWGLRCGANLHVASWDRLSSDIGKGHLSTNPSKYCRKCIFFFCSFSLSKLDNEALLGMGKHNVLSQWLFLSSPVEEKPVSPKVRHLTLRKGKALSMLFCMDVAAFTPIVI